MKIQIAGFEKESVVDGPGIRFVIFSQGCPHHCLECHNPQTHSMTGGAAIETQEIVEDILSRPYVQGVTFSGGDPFVQPEGMLEIARKLKEKKIHLAAYSGYTYEMLLEMASRNLAIQSLLNHLDLLIDGPFLVDQKDLSLAFRGSANQRLIDVPRSLESKKLVLWETSQSKSSP